MGRNNLVAYSFLSHCDAINRRVRCYGAWNEGPRAVTAEQSRCVEERAPARPTYCCRVARETLRAGLYEMLIQNF